MKITFLPPIDGQIPIVLRDTQFPFQALDAQSDTDVWECLHYT